MVPEVPHPQPPGHPQQRPSPTDSPQLPLLRAPQDQPPRRPHTYQQDVGNHRPVAGQKQLPESQEHLWTRTRVSAPPCLVSSYLQRDTEAAEKGATRFAGAEWGVGEEGGALNCILGSSSLWGGQTFPSAWAGGHDPEESARPRAWEQPAP